MKYWSGGAIHDGGTPLIGPDDQALEYGVGLFETLRTWGGRPVLLDRHLQRLRKSAQALRLSVNPDALPDAEAVGRLLQESHASTDSVVRITLTGGTNGRTPGRVWMQTRSLPPPVRKHGAIVVLGGFGLDWHDPLARHKTLNYWSKRLASDRALTIGADDALLGTPDGRIWESTRANLFLVVGGVLTTPGLEGPVLPGIQRTLVIDLARLAGWKVLERDLYLGDVDRADEVFLTNSVRGIVPVGFTPGGPIPAPGPVTRLLQREYSHWVRGRKEATS